MHKIEEIGFVLSALTYLLIIQANVMGMLIFLLYFVTHQFIIVNWKFLSFTSFDIYKLHFTKLIYDITIFNIDIEIEF